MEEKKDESDCSKEKDGCSCCSGCGPAEPIDISSLGKEAQELAKMFEEVGSHLKNAVETREKIIATVYKRANESPEMKEKINKVLESMNPGLLRFIFGDSQ